MLNIDVFCMPPPALPPLSICWAKRLPERNLLEENKLPKEFNALQKSRNCHHHQLVYLLQYVKQTFFSCQDFPQQISIKTKIKFYVVDDQFLDAHLYEELWLIEALWLKKDVQLEIAIFAIISIYCCSFYLSNNVYWVCITILFSNFQSRISKRNNITV